MKDSENIFIIVILVFAFSYLCYKKTLSFFMNSFLGKTIVIAVIFGITWINAIYGLFLLALILLYYDSSKWLMEGFFEFAPPSCSCSNSNSNSKNKPSDKNTINPNPVFEQILEQDVILKDRLKSDFQKKHCSIGKQLMYKNLPVKKEMASFIFPEIKYDDNTNLCNVCDSNCGFTIQS